MTTNDEMEKTVNLVLIEDNPHDVELTLHALRKANVTNPVRVLRDGAEAVEFFLATKAAPPRAPTIILLDLRLPKVSGFEVLARLKKEPSTRLIPVVVLTSSREDGDLQEAYRLGANGFVQKPVEFSQFAATVATLGLYWTAVNRTPPPVSASEPRP